MAVFRLTPRAAHLRRRRTDPAPDSAAAVAGTPAGDRQLLRAAALGDEGAWVQLVDVYAAAVWGDASAVLPAQGAAAVSEVVWCRLAESLPLSPATPLHQWLSDITATEIARALALDVHRTSSAWDGVERRGQRRCSS
jgi:hypothetical protein